VLATNQCRNGSNEVGDFYLQVAFGAQNADVISLANTITVADLFTEAVTMAGVSFTAAVDTSGKLSLGRFMGSPP
jgi:hypothetical protein